MFGGLGMPIPYLSNKPGPGRPGWPSGGAFEFKMEIQGPATLSFNASKSAGGTNFSIDWGDTVMASGLTGTSHSHTYTAGTFTLAINSKDDTGPIDTFQLTGTQLNRNALKKVLNWGETSWVDLTSAFSNCQGLTHVEKSKLYAVDVELESTFEGCSSLTSADFSELNISNRTSIYRTFKNCTALQYLNIKNSNSKIKLGTLGTSQTQTEAFAYIGSGVSTGCEVIIKDTEFVNVRTSATVISDMFSNVRFKDTSNLSGLSFSGLAFDYGLLFQYAHVPQDNSFLNISNWSFNHTNEWSSPSLFFRFNNDAASGVNTDIDTTGWDFGKVTGLRQWFYYCNIRTIRGLSTWTRDNSVLFTSLYRAFSRWFNAKILSNDNFPSSFWVNSRLAGSQDEMFFYAGSNSSDAETGSFPNLNGLGVNATSLIDVFRLSKWNTPADFTGVNQYTGAGQVANTDCQRMFQSIKIIGSDRRIVFNINDFKVKTARTMFYGSHVEYIDISSVVDFSTCTVFQYMFLDAPDDGYDNNVTLPTNMDFSSALYWNGSTATNHFPEISFSTCQIDNLIRRIHATLPVTPSSSVNQIYSPNSQVSASPANVQKLESELVSPGNWTIVVNSTDATLPFAYADYAVDPTGITTISPTTTPPAGSVFTATNSLSINSSTGVITIGTFRGGSTITCTYPDGCYNEVDMVIMVPFTMNITIPAGSTNFELKPKMSAGECFIDWGDSNSQTLTANTTHSYASSGSNQTYPIRIFDSPSGSKFTGFNGSWNATSGGYVDDIAQWGEIEWQDNSWFVNTSKSTITATDTPNLSQVTSLQQMFASNGNNSVFSGGSAISNWNVSTITNMSSMFWKVGSANFTQNLSNWDVSNVTTLQRFNYTYPEYLNYSQNWVADWGNKTSKVEDFSYFMYGGKNNSIAANSNMGNYNTSSATSMSYMFFNNVGDIANCKTKIVNAGQADEYIAWDVKKVENFSYMFAGGSGRFVSTEFPDNWYISGNNQDINMQNMFGWFYGGVSLNNITDVNSFATKTISAGTSPYGTQYTAWDMSNTTNLSGFAQQNNTNQLNWNINTWQISNKLTRFDSAFGVRSTNINWAYTLDQDLGHWDISNVTNATNSWLNNYTSYNPIPTGFSVNFSTANYDSILSMWGSQAASAQSGVTLNMGASQYTASGAAEAGKTALINAGWTIIDGGAIYSNTNALSFNGSQHINVGEDINSTFQGAFSFSCYIWFNNIDASFQSFLTSGFPVQAYIVSGAVQMYLSSTNSSSTETLPTSSTLTAGEWHHVAFTRSGNGAGSENKIYLNGGVADVTNTSSTIIPLSTSPINIGASTTTPGSTSLYFNGKIDEVMIWNTVLTQGEVQAYANVIGSDSIPDPNSITGLQLWNRMGD